MAPLDSTARRPAPEAAPAYRMAPHNIEAEQALLGAILVNNEALYRVADFLEPAHFFEPIHQQIFDSARSLIRTGKLASPITLKTFLPACIDIAGLTVAQYLARLAAEATTIINAVDYGRAVYDLAVRRDLIGIGEDMVNTAFDAPVDFAPREQIEDAERRLYELAEVGRYGGGFQKFDAALTTALEMAAHAYQRDGKLSGLATELRDLDAKMGGLQKSDLIIVAGRPGMGKTALATNIAYNVAAAGAGKCVPTVISRLPTGASSGSSPWKCRPSSSPPASSPSRPEFPRARSGAAASTSAASTVSRTWRSSCSICPCSSTKRAASASPSSPRAHAASSGKRGSIFWLSITFSSCRAPIAAARTTACRR